MRIKRWLFFVLMIFVPCFCYSDEYDKVYNELKNDSTFSPLIKYTEFIEHSFPIIEARMMQIDSELVESTKNDTKEQKIVKYNNRLAQKVFDDYKNYFFEDIKKKSKETGRKIQPDGEIKPGARHVWLDRGIFETEQCQGATYMAKDGSESEMNKQLHSRMERTCLYPDGFEEYDIKVKGDSLLPGLSVKIDDTSKGTNTLYNISMYKLVDVDNPKSVSGAIYYSVEENVFDYNENHRYRNQIQQEIKDGLWGAGPRRCHGDECEQLKGLVQGPTREIYKGHLKHEEMQPKALYKSISGSRSINFTKD